MDMLPSAGGRLRLTAVAAASTKYQQDTRPDNISPLLHKTIRRLWYGLHSLTMPQTEPDAREAQSIQELESRDYWCPMSPSSLCAACERLIFLILNVLEDPSNVFSGLLRLWWILTNCLLCYCSVDFH